MQLGLVSLATHYNPESPGHSRGSSLQTSNGKRPAQSMDECMHARELAHKLAGERSLGHTLFCSAAPEGTSIGRACLISLLCGQAIANRKGGVEAKDLPVLQRMYAKETHLERQLVLLTILKQSPEATLREAVRDKRIVADLQSWILSAVENREFRLAFRVLEVLDKLPVDLEVLKVNLTNPILNLSVVKPAQIKASVYVEPLKQRATNIDRIVSQSGLSVVLSDDCPTALAPCLAADVDGVLDYLNVRVSRICHSLRRVPFLPYNLVWTF